MRATIAEINLGAIASNLEGIQNKVAPAAVMAVVKANAYGHGDIEVSRLAVAKGAQYLGVALADEGVQLRQAGIAVPILVFGGVNPEEAPIYIKYDLEATVYETTALFALKKAAATANREVRVHVKIDTGMGRVGVNWQDSLPFIEQIIRDDAFQLTGLYTHFATSDMMDKSFACLQLGRFKDVIHAIKSKGVKVPLAHAANSGAILDIPDSYFDLVRPGVMMYGYYPSKETTESIVLQPAMTFKTRVLYIKEVERGTSVSYGRTFIAKSPTRIATLPAGYADGYNRLLSNNGQVLIGGKRYPIIGRVCMDLIMADISHDDIKIGDEVVLLGRQGKEEVSVQSICDKLNTIPYEVTCWISKRVPRVYVDFTQENPTNKT